MPTFKPLTIAARLLTFVPMVVSAQEICGLQSVAYNNPAKNGFEVLLLAAQQSASAPKPHDATKATLNLGPPAGFAPIPSGGTPTITITQPASGAISGRKLQMFGMITGPVNTGVMVNGFPAHVQGNQFVTPILTLPATGTTTLTATATTLDGATASASLDVTAGTENGIRLMSAKVAEFSNRPVDFSVTINPSVVVTQITVDFNGDGVAEFTGTDPSLIPAFYTYPQPGIYTAELRVTQAVGQPLISKVTVAAIDIVELRTRACSVYGALRARLTANDVPAAIRVFPEENRARYEVMFNALGSNRPIFASRLGTIATGILTLQDANLSVITTENGQPRAYSVRFAQANDGVWRIEGL